jgi:hypothetical protein
MPADIQARVFGGAQVVNEVCGGIGWVRSEKGDKIRINLGHGGLRLNLTTESCRASWRALRLTQRKLGEASSSTIPETWLYKRGDCFIACAWVGSSQ